MKKKMIRLIYLGLIILLGSCNEYKTIASEQSKFNFNKKMFFNDENKESINVNFNGVEHNLFFNTGTLVTLINNAKFNLKKERIFKQKNIYNLNRKIVSVLTTYKIDSVESNLFSVKDKYLYISKRENENNCSNDKQNGILGSFFSETKNEIELNYEHGFIQISDKPIDKTKYIPLESKFSSSGMLYVKMEVNGMSDFFLFDTGNKTSIFINKEFYKVLPKKAATLSILTFTTNNSIVKTKFDIHQSLFKLSDRLFFSQYVGIDSSKESVLDLQFIKEFNWIIDSKNNKVYCKPIDLKKLNSVYTIPSRTESTGIIDDKILVICSVDNKSKYKVGDEIVSINSQKITSENICEMQNLLNKTDYLNTLNLEVLTPNN